jgi:serine/threonine protein kinase
MDMSNAYNKKEFEIMQKLSASRSTHANIIQAHDLFEGHGNYYIVMELGTMNLKEFLEGNEWFEKSPASRSRVMSQVLSSLAFIHDLGIVHRDIKFENFVVFGNGSEFTVKLIDFGLADQYDEFTCQILSGLKGSYVFLAPEVITKGGCLDDEKGDMWSVGVMMYYLLNGSYPFEIANDLVTQFSNILTAAASGIIMQVEASNSEAGDLLPKLLSNTPSDRPSAKDCLKDVYFEAKLIMP